MRKLVLSIALSSSAAACLISTTAAAQPPDAPAEPDANRPPAPGKGAVVATVVDGASKEPLLDAQVTVVGTAYKAIADLDGRARLELPPGTYELRIWYQLFKARRVQNVVVAAGRVVRIDVALDPDKGSEEVVEVEAKFDRSTSASQLAIRRNAAAVADAVGAQEIAKTPDRNAADAARRVVGATVVGNKYVYVRGLGERYTNSLLNGTPLPSPEPDRQAVPLDLFPAVLLSDLTIAKTFTPDIPGDFAGGSIQVNTRDMPESFIVQATVSAGINTASTFADRLTYTGSSLDWLGIDGGTRALPSDIPGYKLVRLGEKPDGTYLASDELTGYGRSLNAYMSTRTSVNLPGLGGNLVIGNGWRFGGGQKLAAVAALTYGRRFTTRSDEILRTYAADAARPGELTLLNDYRADTGLDQVAWGGLAAVSYEPRKGQRVALTLLHSRSSENEAREITGFNDERAADIRDTRLRFVSRSLTFAQLAGQHTFAPLGGAVLDWNFALSLATSDEPDTRETVYVKDGASGIYSWDRGTLSGSHFFADQEETSVGGGVDWTQPLVGGDAGAKVKFGGLGSNRSRTFDSRRFHYIPRPGVDPTIFRSAPDQLFTDENIGTVIELEEFTRANDAYTAEQSLGAGYLMVDAFVTPWLRVIGGGRLEVSRQTIDSFDPFAAELTEVRGELATADFLPALSFVFKTTSASNLRVSVSRTVARPQLRELAPFSFTDYFGAREVVGNPDLDRTSIVNGDLRFEAFPSSSEVLAVSAFYKHFDAPIEQVILPTSRGVISYENASAARNLGLELELKKTLGFVTPALAELTLLANMTFVISKVVLDLEERATIQTNSERPLAGQSPFVVNLGLDWSHEKTGTRARLLYNVFGPRIAQVGSSGLPDVYEQPHHQLDLAVAQRIGKHLDLKLTAENLLNTPYVFTQGETQDTGDNVVDRYVTGATFTLGLTVSN